MGSYKPSKSLQNTTMPPQAKHNPFTAAPLIGMLLGIFAFMLICNWHIINPLNVGWMYNADDPVQHLMGWNFLQHSPWHFPLGKIPNLLYPIGSSIVYTDSIPLFAIPAKLITSLFHIDHNFQYFGIWLLFCYVLMGYFASRLASFLSPNLLITILITGFFLISPLMIYRASGHHSLAAHGLIIAAIYFYLTADYPRRQWHWLLLIISTSLVHAYLLFMVLTIWLATSIKRLCQYCSRDTILSLLKHSCLALVCLYATLWLAGYFVIPPSYSQAGGYGLGSMNLNALINPIFIMSTFLKKLPTQPGQYEGLNYLGAGGIVLSIIGLYDIIKHKITWAKYDRGLVILCIFLLILALSSRIYLGHIHIIAYKTDFIVGHIFRASGRLFWPVYYLLITIAMAVVIRHNQKWLATGILALALCLNVLDFYHWIPVVSAHSYSTKSNPQIFRRKHPNYDISPSLTQWHQLFQHYHHIIVINSNIVTDLPLQLLASQYGNTINIGYVARGTNTSAQIHSIISDRTRLQQKKLQTDTLYIMHNCQYCYARWSNDPNITTGVLDGLTIIAPNYHQPIAGLQPWKHTVTAP